MKNLISLPTLVVLGVLLESATAQAQAPYPQVPPPAAAAASPYPGQPYPAQPYPAQSYSGPAYPGQAQPAQYSEPLPPGSPAPYSQSPYSSAPSGAAPYNPAPYNPAPYNPSPYSSAPGGPPSYTPAPSAPGAYAPAPYNPNPYATSPYSPSPYGAPSYTPAPGAPPTYTPAPGGPPSYTPAPYEHLPTAELEGPKWRFAADAMFLERSSGGSIPLGYTVYNPGSGNPQAVPTDTLYSDDELFPLEPGLRLEIGRRLGDNTAIDAVYWGLNQWSVGRNIYGDPIGDSVLAFSPWTQTDALIGGFNNYLGYTYKSQVNNVEINERIQFNGYDPYHSLAWLWGFRYFQLSDNFTLSGSDLDTGDFENINWKTQNNLVGLQAGLQWTRGWDRFQVVTEGKAGLYANMYSQKGNNLDSSGVTMAAPAGFVPFDVSHSSTDLAGLFELSVLARYRLNEFLWLRLGYQGYAVTGLALGPRQLGGYSHGGTLAFDGPSLGLEATW